MWPGDADALAAVQRDLAEARPDPWTPADLPLRLGGCWVCFPRGLTGRGDAGDPAWAASVVLSDGVVVDERVVTGVTGAPYVPGLLALRTGRLMERATRGLASDPDVLLLDASGRDHPRRAGLAVHLGAELDMPTIGVTHRPLVGRGDWPADHRGATSPVLVGKSVVACWLRSRAGARPLVVHPGWRVDLSTAVEIVLEASVRHRTPEPLRRARERARGARAAG